MSNYIVEAFKKMSLLESEDISLNAGGIDELDGFLSTAGVDPDEEMVDVYDLEAEAQDELKDSYIGKVVLECSVCHSDIFVDKAEISTDTDEEGLACKDIECPYCMSNEGYTIIGEVAPFNEEQSEELINDEEIEERPEVDVEGGADSVEEEDIIEPDEEELEESLNECGGSPKGDEILGESENYNLKGEYIFKNGKDEEPIGRFHDADGSYTLFDGNEDEDEDEIKSLVHESMKLDGTAEMYSNKEIRGVDELEGVDELSGVKELHGEKHEAPINESKKINESIKDKDWLIQKIEYACGKYHINNPKISMNEEAGEVTITSEDFEHLKWNQIDEMGEMFGGHLITDDGKTYAKYELDDTHFDDPNMYESLENATIETEDQSINLSTDEDGSVSLDVQPKEDLSEEPVSDEFIDEPVDSEGEMIVPLEDESVDEIEAAADANSVEEGEDSIEYEDVAPTEDEEFDEFEEFDEDSFNGLGESYLKSCYENVTGFKTTGISKNNNKLMIEGIIKFDSGNIKETNFVFESVDKNKFEGYNKQISRGNKTFKLNTSVNNKKLVCESLNYNYRSKNENNESVRVYGTVKRK